jgi:hypothetical protein
MRHAFQQLFQACATELPTVTNIRSMLQNTSSHMKKPADIVNHEDLAGFIISVHRIFDDEQDDTHSFLWDKIFDLHIERLTGPELNTSWVPFLGSLSQATRTAGISSSDPRFQSFY